MKKSKKGMTVVRYTKEQVEELTKAINSDDYKSHRRIAIAYADKFEKSVNNVYAKIRMLTGRKVSSYVPKKGPSPRVVVQQVVEQPQVKPLTLPEGMTYQGKAKKVELHADHFRVYF